MSRADKNAGEHLRAGTTTMGFCEGECCEYCNGKIVGQKVDLSKKVRGKYVFFKNVPVGKFFLPCIRCECETYRLNQFYSPWLTAGLPNKGKSLRNRGVSKRIIFPLNTPWLMAGIFY